MTGAHIRNSVVFFLLLLALHSGDLSAQPGADPVVRLDTSKGPIFIRVFRTMAPTTASNFLDLVTRGFYSGKIFHRIENWCIQGGDPNGNGTGVFVDPSTGAPRYIPLEINRNLRHSSPGMVAMARSASNVNSASCQFYILKTPMGQLDGKYAIFGRVLSGMEAVHAMRRGDFIQSAQIVDMPQAQPIQGSGAQKRPTGKSGPVVPYVPPNEIPNSGF
jgi:cyclophilin family peptidyl-prolyl cis-trans isomerase